MLKKEILLIATRNKGKFAEFVGALGNLKYRLVTLEDINFPKVEPKEVGKTFKENAIIKARFFGDKSRLLSLADDSGLIVDQLPEKLGIKTKRYAQGTDEARYLKLLGEMKKSEDKKRTARFVSAVALYNPQNGKLKTAVGICRGKIAKEPKGEHGFGYDPVFIVEGANKHFAQLSLSEKNKVSHRAKALKKIKKYLL